MIEKSRNQGKNKTHRSEQLERIVDHNFYSIGDLRLANPDENYSSRSRINPRCTRWNDKRPLAALPFR